MDLFVPPSAHDLAIEIITSLGFEDYYARHPYDRGWIYRGHADGLIVDIIWTMANYRAPVSQAWVDRARCITVRDLEIKVLAVEELLWTKLYILQRERCDWPDLLSILRREAKRMDWDHLLLDVGEDLRLLAGLLSAFIWLCPAEALQIPSHVWPAIGLLEPGMSEAASQHFTREQRIALLDSRGWFGPDEPDDAA